MSFAAASVAAWGSVQASPAIWSISLALMCAAWLASGRVNGGITPLALAVWLFAAWSVVNTLLLSTSYSAAGVSAPFFLLAGFSTGRALQEPQRFIAYRLFAIGVAGLALWAALQVAFGETRGHAHFETPNTLASLINLALAPTLVALAFRTDFRLAALAAGLTAGLLATGSRGGWISLAVALALVAALGSKRPVVRKAVIVLFGAACIFVVAIAWHHTLLPASLASRFELYAIAWSGAGERLCRGIGYLGFRVLLEARRAEVPSYGTSGVTYFVHNDYLQTLLELGLPGLILLVAVIACPFVLAKHRGIERYELTAALAGIATMAIHAVADFPFYVPICLLTFGFLLGIADRLLVAPQERAARWTSRRARIAQIVIGAVVCVVLVRPAIAEVAAAYAIRELKSGDGEGAAFGFELARRAEPRDWRYALYAGQFWLEQYAQSHDPQAVKLADAAFAAGMSANRMDPSNFLARAATHLRYGSILGPAADTTTIRRWADHALALAPANAAIRRAHDQLVRQLGTAP